MPTDQLTVPERAALLALMAEARELTNAELHAVAGFTLTGEPRRRLVERKLVTSRRVGRSYAHELTDDGWAWCTEELDAGPPARAGSLGGALYALLAGLKRHVARGGQLYEIFQPDVEKMIRNAYAELAKRPGDWVGLADLRERLAGVARADLDAELERMATIPGVYVQAGADQKSLTAADHAAAARFGGDDRHFLMIEAR